MFIPLIEKHMIRNLIILLIVTLLAFSAPSQTTAKPAGIKTVLSRYRTLLLQQQGFSGDKVLNFIKTLSADGTWPDINYTDMSRAGWQPVNHLTRTQFMALAYFKDGHKLQGDKELLRAIERALDHWIEKRYQADNWWWNRIGVPRTMRDIVILLDDRLEGVRLRGVMEVIGQHRVRGTGANLTWSAELAVHHGCLCGNQEKVKSSVQRIWKEVYVDSLVGIQNDWSFHQHGPRLQTFHYGKNFLSSVITIAWQVQGSPWAIPKKKRDILSNYLLEGSQWMCRGVMTVPGTLDRAVSRKNSLSSADLRDLLRLWRDVDPQRRNEIDMFLARQEGRGKPLVGYRHFPNSDFTAYHHPEGTVFLKTISSRTRLTESLNKENLKGVPYLNCGDLYIVRDGYEYGNLQPVWQWEYLPGITLPDRHRYKHSTQQRRSFVGGVGNGQSGLSVMEYIRQVKEKTVLDVRKSWFFYEDIIICLIGGWKSTVSSGSPVTSVEQCRLRGQVKVRQDNSQVSILKEGRHSLKRCQWILHNEVGYVPLDSSNMNVFIGQLQGSWNSINMQYTKDDKISQSMLHILLESGKDSESQGYVIVLGTDSRKLDAIVRGPSWEVIQNDQDCQCILLDNKVHMAAFYAPTSAGKNRPLKVDKPCLALWSEDNLWLSDPTNHGMDVSVVWNRFERLIKLPAGGRVEQIAQVDADKLHR